MSREIPSPPEPPPLHMVRQGGGRMSEAIVAICIALAIGMSVVSFVSLSLRAIEHVQEGSGHGSR